MIPMPFAGIESAVYVMRESWPVWPLQYYFFCTQSRKTIFRKAAYYSLGATTHSILNSLIVRQATNSRVRARLGNQDFGQGRPQLRPLSHILWP